MVFLGVCYILWDRKIQVSFQFFSKYEVLRLSVFCNTVAHLIFTFTSALPFVNKMYIIIEVPEIENYRAINKDDLSKPTSTS